MSIHYWLARSGTRVSSPCTTPSWLSTPVPTLLLVGHEDKTGNIRKSMAAWAKREPGDEYHVITGAGHCANLDRPDQVNALVGTFLARHVND